MFRCVSRACENAGKPDALRTLRDKSHQGGQTRDSVWSASGLPCSLPASLSALRQALNPKGILQQSPGLRGTSYPGKTHATSETTLKGLWPTTTKIQPCRNPVGVVNYQSLEPR